MTTGRINQVTTFRPQSILTTLLLSRSGVRQKKVDHYLFRGLTETHSQLSAQLHLLTCLQSLQINSTLSPRSHIFQAELFLSVNANKNHHLQRELLATGTEVSHSGFPTLFNCSTFLALPLATNPHSPFVHCKPNVCLA